MSTDDSFMLFRRQFPVLERFLYLDSAHQTPLPNQVRSAMVEFLDEGSGAAGPKPVWISRVEDARKGVAELLNAGTEEIAFTKNTSEGLNIAANAVPLKPGDTVLMLEGDHPNNAYAWLNQRRRGVDVRLIWLPDSEVATAATFAPHVDATTKVISLSHVTFHAGQRHDIESIGRLCREKGIYLVVDAMQSVGVLPLDVRLLGVSVLAAGCHKGLFVPQGLGILFVRRELQELQPAYLAMSSMANPPADYVARAGDMAVRPEASRFELGNLNLPALHALSSALGLVRRLDPSCIEQHVLALGDRLIEGLDRLHVRLVGPRGRHERAHIYVLDLPVDPWMRHFVDQNVRVSPERGGIRISFGAFNSSDDVDRLLTILAGAGAPTR